MSRSERKRAFQADASTPRSFGYHRALVSCDVRTAGTAEIEYSNWARLRGSATEIARHDPAEVFSERDTKVAGSLAGLALDFWVKCNLGA
jgi:hypothetical protein